MNAMMSSVTRFTRETGPRVLLLHGWWTNGDFKEGLLWTLGFHVRNPHLSNFWFPLAVRDAAKAFKIFKPEVVVGVSRGGAVAMAVDCGDIPRILLAPAYRFFGRTRTCAPHDIIIHGINDDTIPYGDSVELAVRSGSRLITIEADHRMNCDQGRMAMRMALRYLGKNPFDSVRAERCGNASLSELFVHHIGSYTTSTKPQGHL